MQLSIDGAPYSYRCEPAVRYGTAPDGDDPRLFLDLLVPDAAPTPRPAVLYMHGGGWENGERGAGMYPWINPLLAAHGFVTASATYRLTDVAPFPAQIHDAKAAVRWLRGNADRYDIDPDRIGVWGDSAGGHLAALLGTSAGVPELEGACGTPDQSSAVQAVIARCPPTSFLPMLQEIHLGNAPVEGPLQKLFAVPADRDRWIELASPLVHVRPGVPPFLVVHGTADELVPYPPSEEFVSALRAVDGDATLHTVEGGHHNMRTDIDLPWSDDPWEELGQEALEFFGKQLRL